MNQKCSRRDFFQSFKDVCAITTMGAGVLSANRVKAQSMPLPSSSMSKAGALLLNPQGVLKTSTPRVTSEQLEKKAQRIQAVVEEKTIQTQGLIPMFVRKNDYQLPNGRRLCGHARLPEAAW